MPEALAAEQIIERFCEILEAYGFMFADPAESGEVESPDGELLCVSMEFHGDGAGSLEVLTLRRLCEELVTNALGEDVEQTHLEELDSVKELTNMLCGHLLTDYFGDKPVFNLSIPTVRPITEAEWSEAVASPGSATAVVDGEHPVIVRFTVDSAPVQATVN